jgi:non-canonical purine NTP pyrophosphatase (RdgB/HAM1 family)
VKAVLATSNPGKAREIEAILGVGGIELEIVPLWLGDIESGTSYLENARLKAWSVRRLTEHPVIAEDSGIEVDALGGLPGIRSARFAGHEANDAMNNDKMLRLLGNTPDVERGARYRAVAVLALPSGGEIIGEGSWEGRIVREPRGPGGFGYDPLFAPAGQTRTGAELSAEEKNAVSHRAHALRQLVAHLTRTEAR